jgi:hypothetical protein
MTLEEKPEGGFMSHFSERFGPEAVGLLPEVNSLTHLSKELSHEAIGLAADDLMKELGTEVSSTGDARTKIIKKLAMAFYLGAKRETLLTDQAIDTLFKNAQEETTTGFWWYRNALASVCKNSLAYVRESARNDNAHQGRLTQREEALKSSTSEIGRAWEDRFRDAANPSW